MLVQHFDSVFTPEIAQFAQKGIQKDGQVKTPADLDAAEEKFVDLVTGLYEVEALKLWKRLKPAIAKRDMKAIDEAKWGGLAQLQLLLFDLWNKGWAIGTREGNRDIEQARRRAKKGKAKYAETLELIEFERRKRTVQPSDGGQPIELPDGALNQVVSDRTVSLARDIDEQTAAEIKGHLRAATDPKNPISEKELENRIRYSIGRQKYREQVDAGILPDRKDRKLQEQGLKARARMIAKTELSGAYSTARLGAYLAAGITKVQWVFNEVPKSCRKCRDRDGSVHEIQALLSAGNNRLRQFENNPARRNEWGYEPRQYVIPLHPFCQCYFRPYLEDTVAPGDDPRNRNPSPLNPAWVAAGIMSMTGVLAALALLIQGRRAVAAAEQAIDTARGIIQQNPDATRLAVDRAVDEIVKQVEAKVYVGRFNLNETSVVQLKQRFGLSGQQAIALATSIQSKPLESIADLIQRVESGKIIGLTRADLERKILDKTLLGGVIRVNDAPTKLALAEQFQAIGINRRVGNAIWEELQQGRFENANQLMERLESRGIGLNDRQRDLISNYVDTSIPPDIRSEISVQAPPPSSGTGVSAGIPVSRGSAGATQPPRKPGAPPQRMKTINQKIINKAGQMADVIRREQQAENQLRVLEMNFEEFGLRVGDPEVSLATNRIDDVELLIVDPNRFPEGRVTPETREDLTRMKETWVQLSNQLITESYNQRVLEGDIRDLKRQYNEIATALGFPLQYSRVDRLVSFMLQRSAAMPYLGNSTLSRAMRLLKDIDIQIDRPAPVVLLSDVAEFKESGPTRTIRVKSFTRKGKVVRPYARKIRLRRKQQSNPLTKAVSAMAVGAATLGVPIATYVALKNRYLNGFTKSARLAKQIARRYPADNIADNVKQITFTIGGITRKAEEGRLIAKSLRANAKLKNHHFVPVENKYFKAGKGLSPFKEMLNTSIRLGRNPDSIETAARAYSYHLKYPDRAINFVGHSAGGMISKEAANLLELMGVPKDKIKVVTTGTPDFGLLKPRPNDLNIFAADDPLRVLGNRKAMITMANTRSRMDFREHFVLKYLKPSSSPKSKDILGEIKNYLGD